MMHNDSDESNRWDDSFTTQIEAGLVLATVPDRHFGSGSGPRSKLNRCEIGGPGRH